MSPIPAFLAAIAQPAPPPTPVQPMAAPAIALGKFADLPNIAVTFYDVSGNDVRAVHRSIEAQAPRDETTGRPIPAISDWSIKAAVKTLTTAGRCRITGVRLTFSGTARMPRLVPVEAAPIPPGLQAAWQAYAAQLEDRQVAQLRFAYDRLDQVEREIRSSRCNNWQAAMSRVLARLKQEQTAARSRDRRPAPKLEVPEGE